MAAGFEPAAIARGNYPADSDVLGCMDEQGIPPFVMAFAVVVALLLLSAVVGG